jgi:hypothetical protein
MGVSTMEECREGWVGGENSACIQGVYSLYRCFVVGIGSINVF